MAVNASRRAGRPSLSGVGDSPQLRVRLPEDVREALTRRAAQSGVTVSELARRVLTGVVQDRPEVKVQLELHRVLLGKLIADHGPMLDKACHNIERMRSLVRGPQAHDWLDEWSELITHPGPSLIDVFLGEDEHSIDMRQVSPFAGALTQAERLAAIERARGHAAG